MVPSSSNVAGPENCTVPELSVTSSNVSVELASNAMAPPDTLVLSSNVSVTPDTTVMVPEFCSETSSTVRLDVTSGVPSLLMSAISPALGGELRLQFDPVVHNPEVLIHSSSLVAFTAIVCAGALLPKLSLAFTVMVSAPA